MAIRFARPSEVIDQLRTFRDSIGLSNADFPVFGAAEYNIAQESGRFVQNARAALYVMVGNSSSGVVSDVGSGVDDVTHSLDVVLYQQLEDNRGQFSDEKSVWFKEFVLRAIFGWEPYSGSEPLQFNGDFLNGLSGASSYARTYQFSQAYTLDQSDVESGGSFEDLADFAQMYVYNNAIAPPSDDIAETELDITIEQD